MLEQLIVQLQAPLQALLRVHACRGHRWGLQEGRAGELQVLLHVCVQGTHEGRA